MSVVAHTIARPHAGKRSAVENRARQAAGIYARHGAAVKLSRMIAGPYTGCLVLLRAYADFTAAAKAFASVVSDPGFVEFERERESNPMADILVARNISRRVYGEGQWDTHPVTHMRVYGVTRNNLADALKLLPEASEIVAKNDVNVAGLVPVTGDDLCTMTIAYQCRSLAHWAETLDTVGTSEAFQALVVKASEYGQLRSAGVMAPL